jgi:5-formyltetrahydrofolate cyclo-ligase
MRKSELRKLYQDKRMHLAKHELVRLDSLLLIQFQQVSLGDITCLLSYWPIHEKAEINTHLMIDYLAFQIPGLELAFPVMVHNAEVFKPVLVDDETHYLKNEYGIAEPLNGEEISPEDIDLVFVPLLAFDTNGFRVGYGKGFYDRFLKTCRKDVLKIGFSYFDAERPFDDINEFDVPLNICITPNKIYEF